MSLAELEMDGRRFDVVKKSRPPEIPVASVLQVVLSLLTDTAVSANSSTIIFKIESNQGEEGDYWKFTYSTTNCATRVQVLYTVHTNLRKEVVGV
jgi:hypothetical protein